MKLTRFGNSGSRTFQKSESQNFWTLIRTIIVFIRFIGMHTFVPTWDGCSWIGPVSIVDPNRMIYVFITYLSRITYERSFKSNLCSSLFTIQKSPSSWHRFCCLLWPLLEIEPLANHSFHGSIPFLKKKNYLFVYFEIWQTTGELAHEN